MRHFPIFLNLSGRGVLVAGGGAMAALRARQLLRAGADVHVISDSPQSELASLIATGEVVYDGTKLPMDGSQSWVLAIGADDDPDRNERLHAWACSRGIPVNVVDAPQLCTFIMPAIVDRSPVVIAISTGGASPTLSRLLRERLEALVPAAYGRLALLAESFRDEVKRRLPTMSSRRRFWQTTLAGPTTDRVLTGNDAEARALLVQELASTVSGELAQKGAVWLVGAGPGDPSFLTLRALRVLQQADVVVYDRLVSAEIVAYARPDAEKIYAGKRPGDPHMDQEQIHDLLVKHARAGKRVVRLKGGDPFIFGRGGEEREALLRAEIPVHVVPGITAALACAATAGIPLTHRDHAHQCVFVTGHRCGETLDLDWASLSKPFQTVVFYMGTKSLGEICTQLMRHGMPATTPAALVHEGTTPRQQIVRGSLASLPRAVRNASIGPPSLLIVGGVAGAAADQLEAMVVSGLLEAEESGNTSLHGSTISG